MSGTIIKMWIIRFRLFKLLNTSRIFSSQRVRKICDNTLLTSKKRKILYTTIILSRFRRFTIRCISFPRPARKKLIVLPLWARNWNLIFRSITKPKSLRMKKRVKPTILSMMMTNNLIKPSGNRRNFVNF